MTYLAAIIDAALIYFVAMRTWPGRWFPILCAIALASTPSQYGIGITATGDVFVLPFILAWLLGMLTYLDRPKPFMLAIAMSSLGLGFYTQPAAPLTAIVFAALTLAVLFVSGERLPRQYAIAAASFVTPLLPLIPWFLIHPETYQDTLGAWLIHKAHIRNPLDGLRAMVAWNMLGTRLSIYWELFNPIALLFGTLLTPLALLIPAGLINAASHLDPARRLLLFGGLLLAPVAAASFGLPDAAGRALPMIPFLVLFGSWGTCWILKLDGVRR